jgi:membrane-associated phospholipid phosphatase
MYLGAHTPQDVAVGAVLGVGWVFVSNRMFDYADKTGRKSVFLLFIIPAVIGMFFFRDVDYYKATGTLTSFYIGYLIESRYIKYEVKAELWKQIIKYAAGMGVLLLIKSLLKPMLPAGILSDFIRYFIMGIWVTAAAPFIYKHTLSAKESTGPALRA